MPATHELVMLESGDRLTRAEFHRRYCARPDIKKAELIQGVVYVASPTRFTVHARQHGIAVMWLSAYIAGVPGVELGDNATVFLDADTEVQPDACLFYVPPRDTGARLTARGYIEGAPPFAMEIAASSASYDLHDKKESYRRTGVLEYVAWRVLDEQIDWFRLHGDVYERVEPDADGVITSSVFPGLRLPVAAMLAGNRAALLAAVQRRDGA